jgi:hypothetical protein
MNKRDYIFYIQKHHIGKRDYKRLKCGKGLFLRWDSVRFFIEEDLGLHQKNQQNSFIEGKIDNVKDDLDDDDFVKGGSIIVVKRVPWWLMWKNSMERIKPKCGPVYYPPAVKSHLLAASSSLS